MHILSYVHALLSYVSYLAFVSSFSLCTYVYLLNHCSTVPGNVTEVVLMCKVMDLINQCTADWNVSDYVVCIFVSLYIHAYMCR